MSSSDLRELSEDGYTDREGVVPPGGLLRTSLRMICYSVMENAAVFAMCSNRIMKVCYLSFTIYHLVFRMRSLLLLRSAVV